MLSEIVMAFRKIGINTKVTAVTRVFCGEHASEVAAEMNLDRDSVAAWRRRAIAAIRACFESSGDNERLRCPRSAELLQGSRKHISERKRLLPAVKASQGKRMSEPVPGRCSRCGCEKWYRNGIAWIELEYLLKHRCNDGGLRIPVQKFRCAHCGRGTHLQGPQALYRWVSTARGTAI
jgi:hypothetical protein